VHQTIIVKQMLSVPWFPVVMHDDTDPFVKEWLEKARQGEYAKPAEDRAG
jgi:hypothetical protein